MIFLFRLFFLMGLFITGYISSAIHPQVSFAYDLRSRTMDVVGKLVFRKSNPNLQGQLKKHLPALIKAWEQEAPLFFGQIYSVFNRGFKSFKRTAIINLSHGWSYGSNWFLNLGTELVISK